MAWGSKVEPVGEGGVEPPPGCPDRILNPARLPIPPLARERPDASKWAGGRPRGMVRRPPGYNPREGAPPPTCGNGLPLGILNEFERRLEGAIEGIFTKAFRTGVHPVELATRILKELEAGKTVGVHQVWVPNHFTFRLSPVDRERFEKTERALRRELEQVVRDGAKERGWDLVGPAEVEFETDPSLKQGKFDCDAALVEGATGTSPPRRSETPAPARPPQPASAELMFI